MLYNNNDLALEQKGVENYLLLRAAEKGYPHQYLTDVMPLLEKTYRVSQLPICSVEILPLFTAAYQFAKTAHEGQFRRFIDLPYICHPLELATRLLLESSPIEAVAAALLHDVVEDCGVLLSTIEEKFGEKVAAHVFYLSDIAKPEDGNRKQRQSINFEHFKQSDSDTHNIKLVDLISNTRSLIFCDPRFSTVYTPELMVGIDYFQGKVLNNNLANTLFATANIALEVLELQQQYGIAKLENKKSVNKVLTGRF